MLSNMGHRHTAAAEKARTATLRLSSYLLTLLATTDTPEDLYRKGTA